MGLVTEVTGRDRGDMAVDLGTANTLVFVGGRGIVVSEPSVIAIDTRTEEVHAVGADAERMIGRTPATIAATRPLRHGVIADFEVTEQMLRYFMRKGGASRWSRPRVVMCVPSGVTDVERRAVEEACHAAGARAVRLIDEPLAAAIGAGLAIAEPVGHMVVDVGGGTSEVAVISLGGIVVSRSLRVGGYELDEAILDHVRRRHRIAVGSRTAEQVKFEIGSAYPLPRQASSEIRGRDLVSGLPRMVTLTDAEVRSALEEPLRAIITAVKETLESTPAQLAADIVERGIVLAGGGSLLRGLDQRLRDETQVPVSVADSPLTCVVRGSGESLAHFDALGRQGERSRPRRRRSLQHR